MMRIGKDQKKKAEPPAGAETPKDARLKICGAAADCELLRQMERLVAQCCKVIAEQTAELAELRQNR
jgi:hypothetical protein